MKYPREYKKDLEQLTTIRMSKNMREKAEQAAAYLNMSFSSFVRQSVNRNIHISSQIEEEVLRRTTELTLGKSP